MHCEVARTLKPRCKAMYFIRVAEVVNMPSLSACAMIKCNGTHAPGCEFVTYLYR